MNLDSVVTASASRLASGSLQNEAQVKQTIILPVLRCLGWDDTDPLEVFPEWPVDSRFVDYALTVSGQPIVFIEAKRVGAISLKAESQVFAYAAHKGIPILVLTDGRIWDLYLSMAAGSPSERKFCHIDLTDDESQDAADVLRSFLDKDAVSSGAARRSAEAVHEATRNREQARGNIVAAWENLINEPTESLLVELLSVEVEKLAGVEPAEEDIRYFFAEFLTKSKHTTSPFASTRPRLPAGSGATRQRAKPKKLESITLLGEKFNPKHFVGGYCEVLKRLQARDAGFMARFSQHPRTRLPSGSLASRAATEVYAPPGDQRRTSVKDLGNGWWASGHGSSSNLIERMKLACEMAGIEYGKDLIVEIQD